MPQIGAGPRPVWMQVGAVRVLLALLRGRGSVARTLLRGAVEPLLDAFEPLLDEDEPHVATGCTRQIRAPRRARRGAESRRARADRARREGADAGPDRRRRADPARELRHPAARGG